MNWTEGNLARHSRAQKSREVLLRQREHFAKARSGLLGANANISPPSISVFALSAHPVSSTRRCSSGSQPSATSSSITRTRVKSRSHISSYFHDNDGLELPTPADFREDQRKEEVRRQKRRKLLLKGDWTGINLQKPIEMNFPKPRASLGGPWDHSTSRHTKSMSRMRHMLGIKYDAGQAISRKIVVKTTTSTSNRQLRVRVGSRERMFGGSSDASPQSMSCREVKTSPNVSLKPESRRNERQTTRMHRDCASARNSERRSPDLHELYQPLPHRPFLPSLLRSQFIQSDDAASTKAQIGAFEPDVPASRMDENEEWWNFVGGAEHRLSAGDVQSFDSQTFEIQREISPGVSQRGLPKTIDGQNGQIELVEAPVANNAQTYVSSEPSAQREERLLQAHELDVAMEEVPQNNHIPLASDEANSSSMESSTPRPRQNSRTDEDIATAKQPGDPDASDALSLQVSPTSCSPTSEEMLAQFYSYTNLQADVDHFSVPPISSRPHQPEQAGPSFGSSRTTTEEMNAAKSQGKLPKPRKTKEQECETWKAFVFGECDDDLQHAFEEAARKITAKNLLHLSDSSTSTCQKEPTPRTSLDQKLWETTAALGNIPNGHVPKLTEHYKSPPVDSPTIADKFVSRRVSVLNSSPDPLSAELASSYSNSRATLGASSPDPLSAPKLAHSDTTIRTDRATQGSETFEIAPLDLEDEFLSRSVAWSLVRSRRDNTSLVAEASSEQSGTDEIFKFARPRPFIGKKIDIDENRQIALSTSQLRGKGVNWRRQKRVGDRRTNIRNLPNLNSDPIEDVEEAGSIHGAQKQSLFGSLDTEEEIY